MDRFTRDLRAPAGLTRRAARRRHRRLALRSAAGAAAALTAGTVALVAAGVPGAPRGGTQGPAVPAAYLVTRVDRALSSAEPGTIAQMTVTTRGAAIPGGKATTAEEWSYGDRWRSVTNSLAGHPLYDEGFSTSSVYTLISYLTQTWARLRGPGRLAPAALGYPPPRGFQAAKGYPVPASGPRGCWPMFAAVPLPFRFGQPGTGLSASALPATVARDLRTAVGCGTLAVAGWRVRLAGRETIELTSRRHSLISETIWVNPATDLPVRVVVRSAPGMPVLRQTADITWLTPTAQNLAKLTVPVPAGFRRVPLAKAIRPILQQIPAGLLPGPRVLCPALAAPACAYGPGAFGLGPRGAGRLRPAVPYPAPTSS
jgi:hypothetical protein